MIYNSLIRPEAFTGWKLYQAHVYSLISYGSVALNPECSDVNIVEE